MRAPPWLLAPLGLLAACVAPLGPQIIDDGPDTATTEASASQPTGAPQPECQDWRDCAWAECGVCVDGTCQTFDCPGGGGPGGGGPCDRGCAAGSHCHNDDCVPGTLTDLPACPGQEPVIQRWDLGATPGALALLDLDGDGDLDLAAAEPGLGRVELALNDGAGGFTLAAAVPVGAPSTALSLAVGDLDDDLAADDLAVLRRDGDGGLVLLFAADGVLSPQPPLPTPGDPVALFVGRGDADGITDIVVIGPQDVRTRRGDAPELEFISLARRLHSYAHLVDLDQDGRLDLLGVISGSRVARGFLGDAGHVFTEQLSVAYENAATLLLAADLGARPGPVVEARKALILGRPREAGQGELEVWAGLPALPGPPNFFVTSAPVTGGVALELDAPPGLDILASTGQRSALIVLGDGVGGFLCQRIVALDAPTTRDLQVAGDLDGDGRADLVVGAPHQPTLTVVLTR